MSKTLIEVNNLTKYIGGILLFEDISFSVSQGEKVGLVGLNGCGKSTLLKIIAGSSCNYASCSTTKENEFEIPEIESGNVRLVPSNMKIGFLPQLIEFQNENVGKILNKALDNSGIDEEWQRDIVLEDIVEKVQLSHLSPDHPASQLSGGEKTRLYMAKLLIMEPDFLLMDEPTNFLDVKGLEWIEAFVKNLNQGVLLVSHDRYFLDRVVDRIVELDYGSLYEYRGNYSFYRKAKEERIEKQWEEHRKYKEKVRQLRFQMQRIKQFAENKENSTVNDFVRGRAKIFARKAKAMETRIEKIPEVEKPRKDYMANIQFNGSTSSRIITRVENLSKSFGDRTLYSDVNFTVYAGERLGILGKNGSGKTTLLKILQDREEPTTGEVKMLDSHRVGYFSQVFEDLDEKSRIVDLVMDYTGFNLPEARQLLAHFLFMREEVFKEIKNLSVGERSRVAMACIKGKEPEVLILDEPTNHLDVDTTEILETALQDYRGTIIIVTHDRLLLNNLVEKLLVIEEEKLTVYPGNYNYYLQKKKDLEFSNNEVSGNYIPAKQKQSKLLLECRIASLSAKLSGNSLSDEERTQLQEEFMTLKKEIKTG